VQQQAQHLLPHLQVRLLLVLLLLLLQHRLPLQAHLMLLQLTTTLMTDT
jgi:hypothetical protein